MSARLPISAFVASHDEAPLLHRCLPSIAFCDEIFVIDIDSHDDTAEVAGEHGAVVLPHAWVPIAEYARLELVDRARHEWLLFLDPDEEFAPALADDVGRLLPTLEPDVGVVHCPWQFWFRGRPLRGTIWGGVSRKRALVRRQGVDLHTTVHGGTTLRPGFRDVEVPYSGDNAIAHHWAEGYGPLIEKHRRYLTLEGRDRRAAGLVTGYRDIARTPWAAFSESFLERKGYRDGAAGLALSVLWAAYSTGAKIQLLRELRRDRG